MSTNIVSFRPRVRLARGLKLAIARGPCCPFCRWDGFDDWHLERTLRPVGLVLAGRLRCHACGKFFHIDRYPDGEVHSTAWLRIPPAAPRRPAAIISLEAHR
jgi:hypothetical protein